MFSIGFFELCVIAIVVLVFVGPRRLPELMKQFGQFFVQARRMTNEVKSTMDTVIRDAEQELDKETNLISEVGSLPERLPEHSASRQPGHMRQTARDIMHEANQERPN